MTDEASTGAPGTKIALALGAGGARGYAHIGVIQELRERGFEISGISGSSMGALVGGLEAAGALDGFTSWATSLTQRAVLRLLDPTWTSPGFFRAEKILDVVRELLGDVAIEDLPIPFTAVATDLIAGKSVWLQRGSLASAIRASIAIPGMISPHVLDGRVLADGGVLDLMAVAPLAGVHAELRVAVSLSGGEEVRAPAPPLDPEPREPRVTTEWLNRLLRSTSALFETDGTEAAGQPDPAAKLTSFEVMNRTIEVMQSSLARMQLAAHPPDVLIEVPRSVSRSLDFHRASEVIEVGRRCAAEALDTYANTN
ncbi:MULTISPECIES: patatin-like phospholipase family protein [Mycobacteroides]|jgi:NTE family protein|uniref:Esterase n=2 Tax=Mycobacteroides chelonae TaxID=1774 RepID=A0A0E3TTJ1_MYCCH|nr:MULTISPECIES: patatin-like phospholipase family protein [Mycobacteroides]PKQ57601.1 esterase [Mycobacterium sp. MHSD3]SKL35199.1 NTE family protein rssA [Mycobacteroides abscessus subsp. bolletii]VEG20609.1 putative serine protease [Mycolicibacterium phlei]AKC40900.1 esterase [Mycobacteroides chelonae]ANB00647.1 esterase [Mycobacteroides chelonae CCUG 47445]